MLAVSFGLFSSDASWCLLLLWIPQGHLHIAQVPQGEQVQITQDSEVSQVSCQGHRPYSHALSMWNQCHSGRAWETLGETMPGVVGYSGVPGALSWYPLQSMMV